MSFGEAVRSVLNRWSDFGGRSSRTEFWFWWLFTLGLYLASLFLAGAAGRQAAGLVFGAMALVYLVLLVPSLAVFVRRLHDAGRSGWWWLIAFIPFGGFVLLVFLCLDSTPGPNAFGAPPRGSRYEHQSAWHSYLAGPGAGWGVPGPQQPGWGAPPPPGPQPGWGQPNAAPRPGVPPTPTSGPVPAWQQTQAQTAWQAPATPAPPPGPSAWQQPPTQPTTPAAPPAPSAWQQPPTQPAPPAGPAAATPDPWRPATVPCRTCGQVLAADAAFCSRCGRPTSG